MRTKQSSGFTIVELLIVIVIIAILAAITVAVYNGVQARAVKTALQSDLRNAATKVALSKAEKGSYPTDEEEALALFTPASGTHYRYTSDDGSSYYLTVYSDKEGILPYCKASSGGITEGPCPGHSADGSNPVVIADGSFMQQITDANCPTVRTRAVDARDNHTYWVQKLADGKCWMLTNLGYAGGGTNTYNDVKTLTNGNSDASTYTIPSYYVYSSSAANYTTEPTAPSTFANGNVHYGYLYNWCGAMGGQATSACSGSSTPAPDGNISVCSAGWRLPTSTELTALNTAINSGSTTSHSGLLSTWLGQYSGARKDGVGWPTNFNEQGSKGNYWSATPHSATAAKFMSFYSGVTNPAAANAETYGYAVRCVAI